MELGQIGDRTRMPTQKKHVDIFTDGACSGNPGPGGYGVVLRCAGVERELSGGETLTTNNRMELMGPIVALRTLKYPCRVTLTTDSQYVANGINKGWAKGWRAKGWKRSGGEPALNADLWEQLLHELERHDAQIVWVKGHAGHPENERCDALAVAQCAKYRTGAVAE